MTVFIRQNLTYKDGHRAERVKTSLQQKDDNTEEYSNDYKM